ncbi:MAG: lipoyl(octanoyl) transferase LipB [Gammaproteobacteria bacterium]|nr:lipoyl(octanoyl) transferase LipB [Gammaproteobacteria bacterium]
MQNNIIIRKFNKLCDYYATWEKMREFTANRDQNTPDEIWLLEHYPVFTQGLAGKSEHVLNPGDIPVVATDRGGQVTYHGPGQLVAYVLYDLRRAKLGVRAFVSILENSTIQTLKEYNIIANANPTAPGVYVNGAKICSIGLRVRSHATYHGIALNVNNDLEPFSRINPCGFRGLKMTKLSDFVPNITLEEVSNKISKHLVNNLN